MSNNDGLFRALDEKSLVEYIKATPCLISLLGVSNNLEIKEVGDGNLNFVYIVGSPTYSLIIKQALPYIRCIGEEWPMTKERSYFEAMALKEEARLCPAHVPELYLYDRTMSLIAMRYLEPPHIILRKGLIAGVQYPLLADHMAEFMSKTLFYTSLLYTTTLEHKRKVAEFCGNIEMCHHTGRVVFSDPYGYSTYNHWNSPYLDDEVKAIKEDNALKFEVAQLKSIFCERPQALIHGDLHTSSVMVTQDSTQMIDPEFAFYGPMGFDIGAFLGNLMLSFFSQEGHANQENDRKDYKKWILKTLGEIWNQFRKSFISLWDENKDGPGDAYLPQIYNEPSVWQLVQTKYMEDLFQDSLGFASAKMIRRIVGVAHVEDFESIIDVVKRAHCERKALKFAKMLMKERKKFVSIEEVIFILEQADS